MATKVQKLSIAFPKEMVADIRTAVDSGRYATTSEVIREAVREWRDRERPFAPTYPYAQKVEDLRRMIQEGFDSADRGELVPAEKVYAAARARIKSVAKKMKKRH